MAWMSAICDAHNKKVGVELLYNSVHRKFNELEKRCGRENQHPAEWAPSWATQENGKETLLWPIERGVNILQFCSVSNPLSHTTLSIKWEVDFSKELCCSSLLCRRYDSACRCICECIIVHGCDYTTVSNRSIWLTDGTLTVTDTPVQSRLNSYGNNVIMLYHPDL